MSTHSHSRGQASPPLAHRPMTELTHEDLQPRGNQAAQEATLTSSCPEWAESVCASAEDLWAWAFGDAHTDWWTAYKAATEVQARQAMVLDAWRSEVLQAHIDALSEEQAVDPAQYRTELGEVLDYFQQLELMRASGKSWEELADLQRSWMTEGSREKARLEHGDESVTDQQLQQAHADQVEDQSYYTEVAADQTEWSRMTEDERKVWRARAQAAIFLFLQWAQNEHPELHISLGEIRPALKRCEELNAVAFVEDGICHISREVVVAVERDPAYALSTIQHELRGHPEFDTGFSVGMALYDEAAAGMPGYAKPSERTEARTAEWARYNYFESEIGALLREQSYWVESRDLNQDGDLDVDEQNPLGNPLVLLDALLQDMRGNWEPTILLAYVASLLRRFQADPRIQEAASTAFADACVRTLGVTP
jgi:hypothetical protein